MSLFVLEKFVLRHMTLGIQNKKRKILIVQLEHDTVTQCKKQKVFFVYRKNVNIMDLHFVSMVCKIFLKGTSGQK